MTYEVHYRYVLKTRSFTDVVVELSEGSPHRAALLPATSQPVAQVWSSLDDPARLVSPVRPVNPAPMEDTHNLVDPASLEDPARLVDPARLEDPARLVSPVHSACLADPVRLVDPASLVRPAHLQAARNIVFTNSKSLRDVGLNAAALYSFYSLMNHSCVSNSNLTINKDLR